MVYSLNIIFFFFFSILFPLISLFLCKLIESMIYVIYSWHPEHCPAFCPAQGRLENLLQNLEVCRRLEEEGLLP